MSPLEVLQRGGDVSDASFDAMYPPWIQRLSELFWTPVSVARQAAAFLAPSPGMRVLDVGSGVGKFCLVGACTTGGTFDGIERRLSLVEVARERSEGMDSPPRFHHGDMRDTGWSEYDGIYLYNPFFELTSGPWCQIDKTLTHSKAAQAKYVETVVNKLEGTRTGTRVATYFGFGATMPAGFERVLQAGGETGPLALWVKG